MASENQNIIDGSNELGLTKALSGKTNIFSPEWCDIVFADRNQEYGAYVIRKTYSRNAALAILIAVLTFGFFVSLPLIVEWISAHKGHEVVIKKKTIVDLGPPPSIDKKPPPPPVEPPPPLKTTVRFTPPKVEIDEKVRDEDEPVAQVEMAQADPGTKDQQGDPGGVEADLIGKGTAVIDDDSKPWIVVEQPPTFPGGEEAMYAFLNKAIRYPVMAKEAGISGRVFLTFVVDKEGNINDIKILKGIGGGCDEEAIRAVKTMPKWAPGKQNGRSVPVQFNLPVNFTLRD